MNGFADTGMEAENGLSAGIAVGEAGVDRNSADFATTGTGALNGFADSGGKSVT